MREAIGMLLGGIVLIATVTFAVTIGTIFSVVSSVATVGGILIILIIQVLIEAWQAVTRPFRR